MLCNVFRYSDLSCIFSALNPVHVMKTYKFIVFAVLSCMLVCSCEKAYHDDEDPIVNTGGTGGRPSGDEGGGGNGGTDDDGNGDDTPGKYHTGDVVSVQEFIDNDINCQVFVVGYVVGDCTKSISNAEFTPPFTYPQALLLADKQNEDNEDKVMSVRLVSGSKYRRELNLVEHPGLYGRKVKFFGFRETYLGVPGIKTIDAYELL